MKCKCGCDKEVASKGTRPKLFYSDACRKRYNRTNLQEQTDKRTEIQADEYKRTREIDCTFNDCDKSLNEADCQTCDHPIYKQTETVAPSVVSLTRQQLTNAINAYPQDTWWGSPEHAELLRRLKTMTVTELKAEGYCVPNWKYKEAG